MWLHDQAGTIPIEPPAAISVAQFDEIHGAVMFGGPVLLVIDLAGGDIQENDAAGPEKRHHSAVRKADVAVAIAAITARQHTFELSPAFHHAGKKFRASRIEGRVEADWDAQGYWRRHQMGQGRRGLRTIAEKFVEGNFVPAENFERIQMIYHGQGVEFVQCGNDLVIFDVREPADVDNELGAATL